MLKLTAGIASLALALPAAAQLPVSKPDRNFQWSVRGFGRVSSPVSVHQRTRSAQNTRECLVERATRRAVCHTRAEWELIAASVQPSEEK